MKHQSLLNLWREKVFALLVQLKSQELEHRDSEKLLRGQVGGPAPLCTRVTFSKYLVKQAWRLHL